MLTEVNHFKNWITSVLTYMIVQDDPHIPNWETRDGLLSLIALGNVIVFANALEPPTEWEYEPAYHA